MFKTKHKIIIVAICLFLIVLFGVYFTKNTKINENSVVKIVDVDKVIYTPDRYKGFLGVEGIVVKVDKSKNIFLLGCEDTCITMPVKYEKQMPEPKSKIIVYGKIKEQEDKLYIFEGEEIKTE